MKTSQVGGDVDRQDLTGEEVHGVMGAIAEGWAVGPSPAHRPEGKGWVMVTNKLLVFFLATIWLAYVSRASLLAPRSHGFYRFLSWEAILALGLLNVEVWFRDPFSWHQLISWFLLAVSGFLVLHGMLLLRQLGRRDPQRKDATLIEFEKTTRLVTAGAYRYIRHPLYSSLLFLAWGIYFKDPSWVGGLLALMAALFLLAAARAEEAENVRFFGPAYEAYMKQTKRFIPYLF